MIQRWGGSALLSYGRHIFHMAVTLFYFLVITIVSDSYCPVEDPRLYMHAFF